MTTGGAEVRHERSGGGAALSVRRGKGGWWEIRKQPAMGEENGLTKLVGYTHGR
jgi:hypothetical protein